MRFFDQCTRFVEDVENNKTALREVKLFKSSQEMAEVCRRMAGRLQIPHSQITPGTIGLDFPFDFAVAVTSCLLSNISLLVRCYRNGDVVTSS